MDLLLLSVDVEPESSDVLPLERVDDALSLEESLLLVPRSTYSTR